MNFVNRQIPDSFNSEVIPAGLPALDRDPKWPIRYESMEAIAICADICAILLASVISSFLCRVSSDWNATYIGNATGLAIIASALFSLSMRGKYKPAELLVLRKQIRAVCYGWLFVCLLLAGALSATDLHRDIPYAAGMIFALLCPAALIADRVLIRALVSKGLNCRKFAGGDIVVITDQPELREAILTQMLTTLGFRVTGHFRLPQRPTSDFGKQLSARVIEHVRGFDIEKVIIESDPSRWSELRAFVADLKVLSCPVVLVPIGAASAVFKQPRKDLGSTICFELQCGALTLLERAIKRLVDLFGAVLLLAMLAPLLALTAIAIRLDSSGPILFRQQRCGFNGRNFAIYKFRTMCVLEDGPAIVQARPSDNRITRVGKWLRLTSIDELPQLFNVLNGTMSLVGPRPHAVAHDSQFDKVVRNYAFRRRVKPGLTGWAQVHGCRGPTPTASSIEKRVEYDLWYVDNWSLRLDISILLQTPIEVLRGRNAY